MSEKQKQPCEVCGSTRTQRREWTRPGQPNLWACLQIDRCNARKRKATT